MAKLAEILTGPETWCQGTYTRRRVGGLQYCLRGALLEVFRTEHRFWLPPEINRLLDSENERLARAIHTTHGIELNDSTGVAVNIASWQDEPERTWEDIAPVVEAYDRDRLLNP